MHDEQKVRNEKFFEQFKDKPFWIWNPYEHFLEFLKTQGKCCFNHIIAEPKKKGVLMPIF